MYNHLLVEKRINLGQLAEILLFYDKVTLFISEGSIQSMFTQVDPQVIIPFFEENKDNINLVYPDWMLGATNHGEWSEYYLGDAVTFGEHEHYLDYLYVF